MKATKLEIGVLRQEAEGRSPKKYFTNMKCSHQQLPLPALAATAIWSATLQNKLFKKILKTRTIKRN
ncbi:hypothetical protein [Microcoleus sp. Pol7_A1]|uniref:hypothetical protein n=1 Tax=Microcoleus sp. Pol7_A1 TaxID=2818893 RepID=UPI002FD62954